ncbi:hypothetical protein LOZ55_000978 [Ophidiomyces ophidiicola]|nr:hypothetical protein LOZ55_000978 [Ophidiomyces ophidiicola]KAI1991374.1 hypothetical protein LOZ54_002128 [Ophidiomyces ophidiicola]
MSSLKSSSLEGEIKPPHLSPSTSFPEEYNLDRIETSDSHDFVSPFQGHTRNDHRDMMRMGKDQEFVVRLRFRYLKILHPVQGPIDEITSKSAVENVSPGSSSESLNRARRHMGVYVGYRSQEQGLADGGIAGLFWSYLWTFIGFGFCMCSLAEMASMAPISGGQYHWVSEFASPSCQKALSYFTGWMSVLAWQAGAASGPFLAGTLVQGLIVINLPDYEPVRWHGTLLVCAMAFLIYVFNVWFAQAMPMLQNVLFVVHVLTFMVIIIVLWTLAPLNTPQTVFTAFTDRGGWPSMGLSLMVGQISAIYGSLTSDAAAHMAEEVRDASRQVPLAMAWGYFINCIMALILLVTYLFALPSVEDAIRNPSIFPFLYVFGNAVSPTVVTIITSLIFILVVSSNISFGAAASRQTFSFARDQGLPFAKWLAAVDKTKHLPTNAILFTCICTSLASLIYIGVEVAFNVIITLYVSALATTYVFSIGSVLYQRIYHPDKVPPARWSLGKIGGPIVNVIALLYALFAFFWSFWPNTRNVTAKTFNWGGVMFVIVAIASIIMYLAQGRKVYKAPVSTVAGR